MILANYEGNDLYTIRIRHNEFQLTQEEIDLIQRYDFIENESIDSIQDMKQEIWDLEYRVDFLEQELEDRDNAD